MKKRRKYTSAEKSIIKNIKKQREHICYYCKKDITEKEDLTVDHREAYDGTNTTYENCVIACSKCNNEKRSKTIEQFEQYTTYKHLIATFTPNQIDDELERVVGLLKTGLRVENHMSLGYKAQAINDFKKYMKQQKK